MNRDALKNQLRRIFVKRIVKADKETASIEVQKLLNAKGITEAMKKNLLAETVLLIKGAQ